MCKYSGVLLKRRRRRRRKIEMREKEREREKNDDMYVCLSKRIRDPFAKSVLY
jgi:hypothetical protein